MPHQKLANSTTYLIQGQQETAFFLQEFLVDQVKSFQVSHPHGHICQTEETIL
jgi:hypothetical protein